MKKYLIIALLGSFSLLSVAQNEIQSVLNTHLFQIELPIYYDGEQLTNEEPREINSAYVSNNYLIISYCANENYKGERYLNPITVKINLKTSKLEVSYKGKNSYNPQIFFTDNSGIEVIDKSIARNTTENLLMSWWYINAKSAPVAKAVYEALYSAWKPYHKDKVKTVTKARTNARTSKSNASKKKTNKKHSSSTKRIGKYGQ